jgi:hypothetical protein
MISLELIILANIKAYAYRIIEHTFFRERKVEAYDFELKSKAWPKIIKTCCVG